ncbi:chloride channel protein [Galbitalea soli]|uniref:Chloride channel protein n=1 Tax=Galbitalea soli TaxID=1268042 RepID=A0A7C9PKG8_9MICO|nr:chloride channel protein [Galbitalea soli]
MLVGIGAGIGGMLVTLALRLVQHLAYGYSAGTFLDGATHAPPAVRVVALLVAGVVGALGWWALRRWGRAIVTVERAVDGRRMPGLATLANAALQVVVVGLGASIGREAAPRELGALVGGWLSDRAGISERERRILVACGAGAGLAAVYDVPLGGAVFTLEVLLAQLTVGTVIPAVVTAGLGTLVARLVVPTDPLYTLPAQLSWTTAVRWSSVPFGPWFVAWSIVVGAVLGALAAGFVALTARAAARRPRSWRILLVMPLVFAAVGIASVWLPAILGNGRGLGQIAFDGAIGMLGLAVLAIVKTVATTGTIASGAAGGTLTPALAIGAALGAAAGAPLHSLTGASLSAFALVGAAAFLAVTLRAPVTAIVLVVEFTHATPWMLLPMVIGTTAAMLASHPWRRRRAPGVD